MNATQMTASGGVPWREVAEDGGVRFEFCPVEEDPASATEEAEIRLLAAAVVKRNYERNPNRAKCSARSKRKGTPCQNAPLAGANVCRMHGGAAPQVRAAARVRLEMAADKMARELLRMAGSDDVADSVKLAAIKDALDRAGLGAKTAVEVAVGPTPEYEQLLSEILTGGSRAESRSRRGLSSGDKVSDTGAGDQESNADTDRTSWVTTELAVMDAEVVDEYRAPHAPSRRAAPPPEPQPEGLMPMEQALHILHNSPAPGHTTRPAAP